MDRCAARSASSTCGRVPRRRSLESFFRKGGFQRGDGDVKVRHFPAAGAASGLGSQTLKSLRRPQRLQHLRRAKKSEKRDSRIAGKIQGSRESRDGTQRQAREKASSQADAATVVRGMSGMQSSAAALACSDLTARRPQSCRHKIAEAQHVATCSVSPYVRSAADGFTSHLQRPLTPSAHAAPGGCSPDPPACGHRQQSCGDNNGFF